MPTNKSFLLTASAANLRRLALIRLIFISCLLAALAYVYRSVEADFVHPAQLSILAIFALLTIITFWRLQHPWPVTDIEYFFQLLIDIGGLTIVLYFSGGATNPFVSYYLVPITVSAALLPWRFTWIIAGLSLLAYSLMLIYYRPFLSMQPTMDHSHHAANSFNLHILGMWFTFAISTMLITYFVVKMASALRQQETKLAANREDELRDEQILAVATLAAGTAHELGTPLATMTLLLDELEQDYQQQPALGSDLALLKQQLESCKKILKGLVSTADAHSHGNKTAVAIGPYLQQLLSHWQVLRPQCHFHLSIAPQCQQRTLLVEPTLEQAISNLLNNAADASDQAIEVTANCQANDLVISIRDHGAGIAMEIAEQIGKPFVSTKGKGLGLGLFLSHATINRYGGSIELFNHPEGGTLAELRLPLTAQPLNKSPKNAQLSGVHSQQAAHHDD